MSLYPHHPSICFSKSFKHPPPPPLSTSRQFREGFLNDPLIIGGGVTQLFPLRSASWPPVYPLSPLYLFIFKGLFLPSVQTSKMAFWSACLCSWSGMHQSPSICPSFSFSGLWEGVCCSQATEGNFILARSPVHHRAVVVHESILCILFGKPFSVTDRELPLPAWFRP